MSEGPENEAMCVFSFVRYRLITRNYLHIAFISLFCVFRTQMDAASLEIVDLQITDSGTYTCRAENSVGFAETSFNLTVERKCYFLSYCDL